MQKIVSGLMECNGWRGEGFGVQSFKQRKFTQKSGVVNGAGCGEPRVALPVNLPFSSKCSRSIAMKRSHPRRSAAFW